MNIRNGILTVSTLVSTIFFPWPLTAMLALAASFFEPLVPLSAGIFADVLYYVPQDGSMPVFTLFGLAFSLIAVFVRARLREGIIWR